MKDVMLDKNQELTLFKDAQYHLDVFMHPTNYWEFQCIVYGMDIQSRKQYPNKEEALKSGRQWIQKYIHYASKHK